MITTTQCRFRPATSCLAIVSAVLVAGGVPSPSRAQTTGPGTGQEKISKPNEPQSGPKPQPAKEGPRMDERRPPAPRPIGGKILKMEDQLKQPPSAPKGARQPEVDPRAAANPPRGRGPQQPGAAPAPGRQSHLHMVLRITRAGQAEVISAVEVPGPATTSDVVTGPFVYEVTRNNEPLAVQAVPDPFERRSFPGPEGTPIQGHHIHEAQTTTIVVKVSDANLERAQRDNIGLRFYSIKPGQALDRINLEVLQRLRREERLETRGELPAAKLGPTVRERGRKLAAP